MACQNRINIVLSEKIETARKMLAKGMEWSTVQEITGLTKEEFNKI